VHLITYIYLLRTPALFINGLCSLAGEQNSEKCLTYCSVQIFNISFQGFYAPGSVPPHNIMQYWFYSSTLLSCLFPPDQLDQAEMFCTSQVPAPKGRIDGASP